MKTLDPDQSDYLALWTVILRQLLQWPESKIERWQTHRGIPLLTTKGSFVFHEEPWFWVCPEILAAFASKERHQEKTRELEIAIWYVLADALQECNQPEHIDWSALREQCREACTSA